MAKSLDRRTFLSKGARLGGATLLGGGAASFLATAGAMPSAASSGNKSLVFVAHQDDNLLFINPDEYTDIHAGASVQVVCLTAGDDGLGASYWQGREQGEMAAAAYMTGVKNYWTQSTFSVNGHPLALATLTRSTRITFLFMRLPDGNGDGSGFASTNYESLQKLWTGSISVMHAIDGSTSYTKQDLINTLAGIMGSYQPNVIRTQDYVGTYGNGDHSDHYTTAYLTRAANQTYNTGNHQLIGYMGYPSSSQPANVSGTAQTQKENDFFNLCPV